MGSAQTSGGREEASWRNLSCAVVAGHLAIFVAEDVDRLIIYDARTSELRDVDISHVATGTNKFAVAVAVGHVAIFAPARSDRLMIYDTQTNEVRGMDITHVATGTNKFSGGVAMGGLAILAPAHSDRVMIYDTQTGKIRDEDISHLAKGAVKFSGAVAVGPFVIFVPRDADHLLIYDARTGEFHAVDISHVATCANNFAGAAAVGPVVIFAPADSHHVMMYDTDTREVRNIDITPFAQGKWKFSGAVAAGPFAILSPGRSGKTLVFDTRLDIVLDLGCPHPLPRLRDHVPRACAVAVGHLVVWAPAGSDSLMVWDSRKLAFTSREECTFTLTGADAVGDLAVSVAHGADSLVIYDARGGESLRIRVADVAAGTERLPGAVALRGLAVPADHAAAMGARSGVQLRAPSPACAAVALASEALPEAHEAAIVKATEVKTCAPDTVQLQAPSPAPAPAPQSPPDAHKAVEGTNASDAARQLQAPSLACAPASAPQSPPDAHKAVEVSEATEAVMGAPDTVQLQQPSQAVTGTPGKVQLHALSAARAVVAPSPQSLPEAHEAVKVEATEVVHQLHASVACVAAPAPQSPPDARNSGKVTNASDAARQPQWRPAHEAVEVSNATEVVHRLHASVACVAAPAGQSPPDAHKAVKVTNASDATCKHQAPSAACAAAPGPQSRPDARKGVTGAPSTVQLHAPSLACAGVAPTPQSLPEAHEAVEVSKATEVVHQLHASVACVAAPAGQSPPDAHKAVMGTNASDAARKRQAPSAACAAAPAPQSRPDARKGVKGGKATQAMTGALGHVLSRAWAALAKTFKATGRSEHFVNYVENFAVSKGCVTAHICVQHCAGIALSKEPQQRKEQLIWVYTGNALYKEVNACLNTDELVGMKQYSGYIRELRDVFRTDDPHPVVVFHKGLLNRGIQVDNATAYVKQFCKDEEFMWASFTSTSKSTSGALPGSVRFEIQCSLDIDGKKAEYAPASVYHLSQFPQEDEVLFPPHVAFRVLNIKDTTLMLETVEFPSVWGLISARDWHSFEKWAAVNAPRVNMSGCAFSMINAVTTALVPQQLAAGDPAAPPMVDPLLVCLRCQADINEVDPETGALPVLTMARAAAQAVGPGEQQRAHELLRWCIEVGGDIFAKGRDGEAAVDVFPGAARLEEEVAKAGFAWEYCLDAGVGGEECGWHPYTEDACEKISTMYAAWRLDQSLSTMKVRSKGYDGSDVHFALHFADMTQTDVSTGMARKIRRRTRRG